MSGTAAGTASGPSRARAADCTATGPPRRKAETGGRFGFGETLDGVTWKALAPPKVSGVGEGEVGAIEKIGDKYYMMFGTGGHMVTLVADRPEGPFVAARKNLRLLAGHTYFARFFPTPEGVLVNHHSIARDGQVYFGTLKATQLDAEGTLRLAWWRGNEQAQAPADRESGRRLCAPTASAVTLLDRRVRSARRPDPGRHAQAAGIHQCAARRPVPRRTATTPARAILVRAGGIARVRPDPGGRHRIQSRTARGPRMAVRRDRPVPSAAQGQPARVLLGRSAHAVLQPAARRQWPDRNHLRRKRRCPCRIQGVANQRAVSGRLMKLPEPERRT